MTIPTTSHTAYDRAKTTVKPTHEEKILTAIAGLTIHGMYPGGATNYEIGAHAGLSNVQVARRCAGKDGLEGQGLIVRGADRFDKTAGQECETWKLKEPEPPPTPEPVQRRAERTATRTLFD